MKFFLTFAAIVAVTSAQFFGNFGKTQSKFNPAPVRPNPPPRPSAPAASRIPSNDQAAQVIRYDNEINPDGSFAYALDTDNGISAQAQGTPRALGGNPPVAPIVQQGSYSWTSPEGQLTSITYIADENGYQATGDAIPTPPPIPEAILRAIEYNTKYGKNN